MVVETFIPNATIATSSAGTICAKARVNPEKRLNRAGAGLELCNPVRNRVSSPVLHQRSPS